MRHLQSEPGSARARDGHVVSKLVVTVAGTHRYAGLVFDSSVHRVCLALLLLGRVLRRTFAFCPDD